MTCEIFLLKLILLLSTFNALNIFQSLPGFRPNLNFDWLQSCSSQPIDCLLLLTNSIDQWSYFQVQAVDQDLYLNPPGQVRYRLNGDGANTHFTINEITGDVRVAQLLDREHRLDLLVDSF